MARKGLLAIGIVLLSLALLMSVIVIVILIQAEYSFNTNFKSYWELSDRSSTLSAKEQYINQFVDALQKNRDKFEDYDAVFLKTPQNSFDNNLKAVITLRDRLKDIQQMNETSFEYQTAIQQITAQEQGEADAMMSDIQGCYFLKSYPFIWDWFMIIELLIVVIMTILGTFCITNWYIHKDDGKERKWSYF